MNPIIDPNKPNPTDEELLWECLHNFETSQGRLILDSDGGTSEVEYGHIIGRLHTRLKPE